ncbi:MAG: histidinol dehydrogenase [Oscillospiraceae bacterium]|nr:histidinol dehydrogenase [Oscillospiraceae bacterium]
MDARKTPLEEIVNRKEADRPDVSAAVLEIIDAVRLRKDEALRELTLRFDSAEVGDIRVSDTEIAAAKEETGEGFMEILKAAAKNIRDFHKYQLREGYTIENGDGVVMGQRVMPLERVGVYVPGGTAPYPSTVLMNVIPAKIAGVSDIALLTPPRADGSVDAGILAAAAIAGANSVYKVGGAQAIAALAFGTQSIKKVDKIVGPGNIYVATAKKMIYGMTGIDMIAGPSDILVIADSTADASFVAADLLSQAEHDEDSSAILITPDLRLAEAVRRQTENQISRLERSSIAKASIAQNGMILICKDLGHATEISNALAPEHLELCVAEPFALLEGIRNAGSVFLGHYTPEALGDYFAGPNHTLPTMGTARFSSPLSVDDFLKKSSFLSYSREAFLKAAPMVEAFASKEGLTAHAKSVAVRMEGV